MFKPKKILDFIIKYDGENWDKTKLLKLESMNAQGRLFDDENNNENDIGNFDVVNKVPYKFSFVFTDDGDKKHIMMIEDWETGMLYWNSLVRHNGDEQKACEDVKRKYFDDFAKTKDYYFFLGTTKLHHFVATNPFVIIGDFRPKFLTQDELF